MVAGHTRHAGHDRTMMEARESEEASPTESPSPDARSEQDDCATLANAQIRYQRASVILLSFRHDRDLATAVLSTKATGYPRPQ